MQLCFEQRVPWTVALAILKGDYSARCATRGNQLSTPGTPESISEHGLVWPARQAKEIVSATPHAPQYGH